MTRIELTEQERGSGINAAVYGTSLDILRTLAIGTANILLRITSKPEKIHDFIDAYAKSLHDIASHPGDATMIDLSPKGGKS